MPWKDGKVLLEIPRGNVQIDVVETILEDEKGETRFISIKKMIKRGDDFRAVTSIPLHPEEFEKLKEVVVPAVEKD